MYWEAGKKLILFVWLVYVLYSIILYCSQTCLIIKLSLTVLMGTNGSCWDLISLKHTEYPY